MSIATEVIVIMYFIFGIILTSIWWKDEYEPQYKTMKKYNQDVDEFMVTLLLLALVFGWPLKLILNRFY